MNPSYISTNQKELFNMAHPEIKELITNGEVDRTTAVLGKVYKLPIGMYVALSNIISFILIGAIEPKNVLVAIQDILKLSEEDAYKLAEDLEKSILQKARIKLLNLPNEKMVVLTFDEEKNKEELRKELLDTTRNIHPTEKKESNTTSEAKEPVVLTPGSRSQLLEQLQILDTLPNDDAINSRLDYIKNQITELDKKNDNALNKIEDDVPLQGFMFGEKGSEVVEAKPKVAGYAKAPTKYNIDPYKEPLE